MQLITVRAEMETPFWLLKTPSPCTHHPLFHPSRAFRLCSVRDWGGPKVQEHSPSFTERSPGSSGNPYLLERPLPPTHYRPNPPPLAYPEGPFLSVPFPDDKICGGG